MRQGAISRLPIAPYPTLSTSDLATASNAMRTALASVDDASKAQAYQAWLGYYKGFCRAYHVSLEFATSDGTSR
jgi:ATP-dependent RNA helicase MSS116